MKSEAVGPLAWTRPRAGKSAAWWMAVAAYAITIFVVSSQPHPLGVQRLPPFVDKLIHAAVFGGLSFTLWMALRYSVPRSPAVRLSLISVFITTLYGLSDEVHQSFVPGRTMEALDLVADGVGACLVHGMIVIRLGLRKPEEVGGAR